MKYLRLWFVAAIIGASLWDLGYEDPTMNETADELFSRVMANCTYMTSVGTAGGAETLEEFEQ